MICFVLINAAPSYEHLVYNTLTRIPSITEVHPLFGEYDIIVKIEIDTLKEMEEIIINKIKSIKGVIDTKTLTGSKF